jgi:hypothetical protein
MPRGPKGQRLSDPVEQRDEDSNKAKPRSSSNSHTKAGMYRRGRLYPHKRTNIEARMLLSTATSYAGQPRPVQYRITKTLSRLWRL